MALRSHIKATPQEGKHAVTYTVGSKETGGSTADVEISWEPAGLGMPTDISPAGPVQSAGKLTWASHHIDEGSTYFEVTLHCAGSGTHTVTGTAKEHGGDTYTEQTTADC